MPSTANDPVSPSAPENTSPDTSSQTHGRSDAVVDKTIQLKAVKQPSDGKVFVVVLAVLAVIVGFVAATKGLKQLLSPELLSLVSVEYIVASLFTIVFVIIALIRDRNQIGKDFVGVGSADASLVCANVALFAFIQCVFYYKIASKQYDNLLLNKFGIITEYLKRDRPLKPMLCDSLMSLVNVTMFRNMGLESPEGYTLATRSDVVEALTEHAKEGTIRTNVVVQEEIDASEPKDCFAVTGVDGRVYYFIRQDNIFEAAKREAGENQKHNIWTVATWGGPYVVIFGLLTLILVYNAQHNELWQSHHWFGALLVAGCFTTEIIYFFGVFKTYQVAGDWMIFDTLFKRKFGE